jgi:hypothetical protein
MQNAAQQPPKPPAKKFPGMGQFDSVNSTYHHVIYLTNGKKLDGYSKSKLYPEMQDKIVLLEKIILRLYNSGYFKPDRVTRIEYYRKNFLEGTQDLILVLEPERFHLSDDETLVMSPRFQGFLNKFYLQVRSGTVSADIVHKAIRIKEADVFSLEYRRFKTEPELLEFILSLKKLQYPDSMIMAFYYKYKEKFLS